MANYTYTKDKDGDQVVFRIYRGNEQAATARLMVPTQDFESYAVVPRYRRRGLSYALTYAMLVYCRKKHYTHPQVSNAHGPLLTALPRMGFVQHGPQRVMGREIAASFRCIAVDFAIAECRRRLEEHDLQLSGPVSSSRGCIIL